jgi:predicted GIY-YIG superfamily endonuclease
MMNSFKHIMVFVLMIAIFEIAAFPCTGGYALGLTSAEGNMLGATNDWFTPLDLKSCTVVLVKPAKGFRFLQCSLDTPTDWGTCLNEKGVCFRGFFREGYGKNPPAECEQKRIKIGDLMGRSTNAEKCVKLLTKNLTKCGTGVESYWGQAMMIMDWRVGYLVEGLDYVYDSSDNHAILGPMNDVVFAHANFYLDKRLRERQKGIGAGYSRAERMWELLVKQQYASITLQPDIKSGITLPYMIKVLRDRGTLTPQDNVMSPYTTPGQAAICLHGQEIMTYNAQVLIPAEENTDLLSVMWITLGEPNTTPFLPFYIGINDVPLQCKTTEAAKVFHELRQVVNYHPEYFSRVQAYWTNFELQTIEEASRIEQEIKNLMEEVKDRKISREKAQKKSRRLLTEFVEITVGKALKSAQKMSGIIEKLPIVK